MSTSQFTFCTFFHSHPALRGCKAADFTAARKVPGSRGHGTAINQSNDDSKMDLIRFFKRCFPSPSSAIIFPKQFYMSSLCDKALIKCYAVKDVEHVLTLKSQSDFTRTYYNQYMTLSCCRQSCVPVRLFLCFFPSFFLSFHFSTLLF